MATEKWDERYSSDEYAYGTHPNEYFKSKLISIPTGKILLPAEGEGRNAVFAALNNWQVFACDFSIEGKKKAENLAVNNNVIINYEVGDFGELDYPNESFDAIGLIYSHFSAEIKFDLFKRANSLLKSGGYIIAELFCKNNLKYVEKNPSIGGPKDLDMLFSIEEISEIFHDFEILELLETEVELNEGLYHIGLGSVIRFFGIKK